MRACGSPSGHAVGAAGTSQRTSAATGSNGGSHATSATSTTQRYTGAMYTATLRYERGLHALDDGRDAHAAADAQRDQRGRLVRALELVECRAEQDRTGRAE